MIIDKIYQVCFDRPLDKMSIKNMPMEFYEAVKIGQNSEKKSYYAVLIPHAFLWNSANLSHSFYKNTSDTRSLLSKPLGYEIIEQKRVLIFPYHKGIAMDNFVKIHPDFFSKLTREAWVKDIIQPLIKTFYMLEGEVLRHGNINPSNIYMYQNKVHEISECCSAPCGALNSSIFRPCIMEYVDSFGSDTGNIKDDYYSLGVSLLFALTHKQSIWKQDPEQVAVRKMHYGTYRSFIGEGAKNVPIFLRGLLEGLVHDDPVRRWEAMEVMHWCESKSGREYHMPVFAKVPKCIEFNNAKYVSCEKLACEITKAPTEAIALISDASFLRWIRETKYGAVIANDIKKLVDSNLHVEITLSIASMLMRIQKNVIIFSGIGFTVHGIGNMMAYAYYKEDIGTIDILHAFLVQYIALPRYYQEIIDSNMEESPLHAISENFVHNKYSGIAIEKSFYEMHKFAPCYSHTLHVSCDNIVDIILGIDHILQEGENHWLLDKHIIAFLLVRGSLYFDTVGMDVTNTKNINYVSNVMPILIKMAYIVKQNKPNIVMHGFISHITQIVSPHIDGIQDTLIKQQMLQDIEKICQGHDLSLLEYYEDLDKIVDKDQIDHQKSEMQIEHLRRQLKKQCSSKFIASHVDNILLVLVICFTGILSMAVYAA